MEYSFRSSEAATNEAKSSLLQLLLSPIHAYHSNLLIFLRFPSSSIANKELSAALGGHYSDLLSLQPFSTRRKVAHVAAQTALKAGLTSDFIIDSTEGVNIFFGEFCDAMIRDQKDGGLMGPKRLPDDDNDDNDQKPTTSTDELPIDWEDIQDEQNMIARLVHLIKTSDRDPVREVLVIYSRHMSHFIIVIDGCTNAFWSRRATSDSIHITCACYERSSRRSALHFQV